LAASPDDQARIDDLFSAFEPVQVRRMFGAAGLYAAGVMFGILKDGVVYLKADETLAAAFTQAGSEPFAYDKAGRRLTIAYWRLPQHLYDDPEELAVWAQKALACARSASKQASKPTTKPDRGKSEKASRRSR
jgi:DNA transformation protein